MATVVFEVAVGNIRSTPRMTKAEEEAAVEGLFDFAQGAELVFGNEIDHRRLRRIWRQTARRHGYRRTYGCRAGSENVISVRRNDWKAGRPVVRWLSAGVAHVTPRRTTIAVDLQLAPTGLWLRAIGTHLVSQWQPYAKVKAAASWALRRGIGNRSVSRLAGRVDKAKRQGRMALVVGDVNALEAITIADGQVQVLGTRNAGGNLGKMLQAAVFPPDGAMVSVTHVRRRKPVATDHPYRAATIGVTTR